MISFLTITCSFLWISLVFGNKGDRFGSFKRDSAQKLWAAHVRPHPNVSFAELL